MPKTDVFLTLIAESIRWLFVWLAAFPDSIGLIVATHIHTFLVTCFRTQKIGKVKLDKKLGI